MEAIIVSALVGAAVFAAAVAGYVVAEKECQNRTEAG